MAFYGNPDTLRNLLPSLRKFIGASFSEEIEAWNPLVVNELDAELAAVFSSWPPADDTDRGPISNLWHYLMLSKILDAKHSEMTSQGGAPRADKFQQAYENLRDRIKAGHVQVPGAKRAGALPLHTASTNRRLTMGDGPDEPKNFEDIWPHGLRR